jgi:gliding motility-associated-like protein
MIERKMEKIVYIIVLALTVCVATAQEYTVSGGLGEPLLAVDNTNYRIKIFLVWGMENVKVSYISASTAHKWYRYRTKVDALNPEAVASVQNGTSSYITGVEDEYGYYVDENGNMRYYVFIIDYSKLAAVINSIEVASDVDPCVAIRLTGDADIKDINYYTPGGALMKVAREFQVSYQTQKWNETLKQFSSDTYSETFSGNPFARSFTTPPLTDTEIRLQGDEFARHFGVEQSAVTDLYEAKALEIHADTTVVSTGSGNVTGGSESEFSAPALILFKAYGNTPVASRFLWQIFREEEPDKPLIHSSTEEVEYTFDRTGTFIAKLEVSDRSGSCLNDEHQFQISITETVMEIPNAFSPGTTPGVNDVFRVKYKSVVDFHGRIYNRWGNELFSWSNPADGWDGKYRGSYVPAGAYYYLIEYTGTDGKTRVRKGDVNVFRSKSINLEKTNPE